MRQDENVLVVASEWVSKAENDLKAASHLLRLGEECPADVVCFHAQQCAEKYIKAVLVLKGLDVPRTHDVETLVGVLPKVARPSLSVEEQRTLTGYATVMRYPGDYEPTSLAEVRRAVRLARRVRREMRSLLPREAIRRRIG